mgnify:CR=1 FL=1
MSAGPGGNGGGYCDVTDSVPPVFAKCDCAIVINGSTNIFVDADIDNVGGIKNILGMLGTNFNTISYTIDSICANVGNFDS